jgi:4-hydroxy-tetrahydrodipicolinate synthase
MQWQGVYTALVTPFWNGKVDQESLERLVQNQVRRGIRGFVIGGTTGEGPTLSEVELEQVFRVVKLCVSNDCYLVVGTGTNSTADSIRRSQLAQSWGADAVMAVVPYYNKPPQRGLVQHFKVIADAIELPLMLYNVPSRTGLSLTTESILALADHPRIEAIKEASGHLDWDRELYKNLGGRVALFSGDDATYEDFLALGGPGIVSVASHILPEVFIEGKIRNYLELIEALYVETNPIPVKWVLYRLGLIRSPECRLPLVTASADTQSRWEALLTKYADVLKVQRE